MPYYLGKRKTDDPLDWVSFFSPTPPTKESHGDRFCKVAGPFVSKAGASYYHRYGRNDPECRTAADAERLALDRLVGSAGIGRTGRTPGNLPGSWRPCKSEGSILEGY